MEVKIRREVSSAAQGRERELVWERAERVGGWGVEVVAMQKLALLFTQKTSRQQEETPRFGGRLLNARVFAVEDSTGWDWSRTRTTSRGVTMLKVLVKI